MDDGKSSAANAAITSYCEGRPSGARGAYPACARCVHRTSGVALLHRTLAGSAQGVPRFSGWGCGFCGEKANGTRFLKNVSDPGVEDWIERTTLPELVSLCRRASLVIANDSGVAHLAATLAGASTLVLFGPGDPDYIRPLGDRGLRGSGFGSRLQSLRESFLPCAVWLPRVPSLSFRRRGSRQGQGNPALTLPGPSGFNFPL